MQIWSNLEIRVCNTSKKFSVAAKASDANIAFLLPIARISKSCHSQIWELQGNITMVLNTSERTLSYRRAEWFDCEASSISLEICLRDACLKLKSTEDRSIELNGGKLVTGIAVKDKKPGYLLHLTTELPGESASIVPSISKSVAEVDVTTVAPPVNHEFVDGDAFLYVKGNDVCLCATGLRDGGIEYFLHALFKRAKIRKDSANFFLIKAADMKKVAMINS